MDKIYIDALIRLRSGGREEGDVKLLGGEGLEDVNGVIRRFFDKWYLEGAIEVKGVYATQGFMHSMVDDQEANRLISRFIRGDFGDVCEEDVISNGYSLLEGTRLLARYEDRYLTYEEGILTLMLVEEY